MLGEMTTGNWIALASVIVGAITGILIPIFLKKKNRGEKKDGEVRGDSIRQNMKAGDVSGGSSVTQIGKQEGLGGK